MYAGVASRAQRNQVRLGVIAGLAAEVFMVNLKVGHRAARLASPTISAKDPVAQSFINVGLEPQRCTFRSNRIHKVLLVTWYRNVCLSSLGRNLKNRNADCSRTSGLSFSRFAPA